MRPTVPDGWQVLDMPVSGRILRTTWSGTATPDPAELLDGVTAGLAEHLVEVFPLDDADGRLLHAATDTDGVPLTVETVIRPTGGTPEAFCWITPTADYPAHVDQVRRRLAGRPPVPLGHSGAGPSAPERPSGVAVVEARVTVPAGVGTVQRRGPAAWADLPGLTGPTPLPAAAVPAWLVALAGAGPRPLPGPVGILVTAPDRVTALLDLGSGVTPARVRSVLGAPDLAEPLVAALTVMVERSTGRWWLDWAAGRDVAVEPADPDWSSAELLATGRLDLIDAGSAGLWRILPDPPTDFAPDGRPDAVALFPTTTAAVWRELVTLFTA